MWVRIPPSALDNTRRHKTAPEATTRHSLTRVVPNVKRNSARALSILIANVVALCWASIGNGNERSQEHFKYNPRTAIDW